MIVVKYYTKYANNDKYECMLVLLFGIIPIFYASVRS
jgi:hypothetical protein